MGNVMTVKEVAEYLKVHHSTIYRLVKTGQIPAFRIGSDWRFNREQIEGWATSQMQRSHLQLRIVKP